MDNSAAAGWYTDPIDAGQVRWWDGAQWTDRVAQQAPQVEPKALSYGERFRKAFKWTFALAVVGAMYGEVRDIVQWGMPRLEILIIDVAVAPIVVGGFLGGIGAAIIAVFPWGKRSD